jgi:hypothetical protein
VGFEPFRSVDLDGAYAFGASGRAGYLFDAMTGKHLRTYRDDRSDGISFGRSAALAGGHVFIGEPANSLAGEASGAVYMFDRETTELVDLLLPSGPTAELGSFGASLDANDRWLVVGATHNLISSAGEAHVYDSRSGVKLRTLVPSVAEDASSFGRAITLDGDRALIAAGAGPNGTAAYLFDVRTGQELLRLEVPTFAYRVALSDSQALVGDGLHHRGVAYLYDLVSGKLIETIQPASGGSFADAIAMGPGVMMFGDAAHSRVYSSIPEPAGAAMFGIGLAAAAAWRRFHSASCQTCT